MKQCTVEVDGETCQNEAIAKGMCRNHYMMNRRYGRTEKRANGFYKDEVGYVAAHLRVARKRGKARTHQCVDCTEPAAHWAYMHNGGDMERTEVIDGYSKPYSLNPEHYQPMCISHHKIYDLYIEKV